MDPSSAKKTHAKLQLSQYMLTFFCAFKLTTLNFKWLDLSNGVHWTLLIMKYTFTNKKSNPWSKLQQQWTTCTDLKRIPTNFDFFLNSDQYDAMSIYYYPSVDCLYRLTIKWTTRIPFTILNQTVLYSYDCTATLVSRLNWPTKFIKLNYLTSNMIKLTLIYHNNSQKSKVHESKKSNSGHSVSSNAYNNESIQFQII